MVAKSKKKDFKEILAYISEESDSGAQRVTEEIQEKIELIREFPGLGHVIPSRSGKNRQVIVFKYRIIYTVKAKHLFVKRIIHGARNFPPTGAS